MTKTCFSEFTRHNLLLMPILVKNLPNLNQPKTSYLHFPADVLQRAVSYSWLLKYFSETRFCVLKSFNLTLLFCLSFISYWFRCGALERGIGYYCDQTNKSNEKSGPSWTWNPADMRGISSCKCICRPLAQLWTEYSIPANQYSYTHLWLVKMNIQYDTSSQMFFSLLF